MSDLEPIRKLEHNEKALDSSTGQAFDAGTHIVEPAQVKAAENAIRENKNSPLQSKITDFHEYRVTHRDKPTD